MSLIAPADQQKLRDAFAELTRPVRLLFFTQALGSETCLQTRRILDELPPLSDKIAIDEVNFVLEPERAAQYGIDRVPAIAVTYEEVGDQSHRGTGAPGVIKDTRIRFLGAPSGYEFVSLVRAIILAGGGESMLSPEGRARLASVDKPVTMQVFTTPT
jgi:alkyl hydroperoxide reductase subunit AhpF